MNLPASRCGAVHRTLLAVIGACVLSAPALCGAEATDSPYAGTLLVQLAVRDLDRSIEFYRDTLGFELESRDDELNWARIATGINGITIGLGEQADPTGSGSLSLNFGVRDVPEMRTRLEAQGVEFTGPTIHIPGVVRLADLHDPDGNKIRLADHPDDDATNGDVEHAANVDDAGPLSALSWMEGKWAGSHGDRRFEEHWSDASAGNMTGMFRMTQGDKVVVLELITLAAEEDSIVMRLRHFGNDLTAWEESALVFDLVEVEDGRATFENRGKEGPTWAVYSLKDDQSLDIWVGATREPSERGFNLPMKKAE